MTIDRLREVADVHRDRIADFCSRLIQTPSLPGQEMQAAELIMSEMKALGYDAVWQDEVGNVIGLIKGDRAGKSLMLNTHMDHVDVGDRSSWEYDPYSGEVRDGYVCGRGAVDIKGPTSSQVYAPFIAREAGLPICGDVYVVGVVQEEVGGLGSIELGKSLHVDCAVVGEPSSNTLRRGNRGRIEIVAIFRGRSCHASMPDRGINPHYSMANFVAALKNVDRVKDPFLGVETFTPTLVYTDQTSSNVVPSELRLHIDWRTVPQRSTDEIKEMLAFLLEKSLVDGAWGEVRIKDVTLTTYTGATRNVPAHFPSFLISEEHPLVKLSKDALSEAFSREVEVKRWDFATDAGHLMAAGIPSIGFGPGDETLAHTNQEKISIEEMVEASIGYALLCHRLTDPVAWAS